MSAARPSKATMTNALDAIIAAGLVPGALSVGADGSFRVEVVHAADGAIEQSTVVDEDRPERFEDLA